MVEEEWRDDPDEIEARAEQLRQYLAFNRIRQRLQYDTPEEETPVSIENVAEEVQKRIDAHDAPTSPATVSPAERARARERIAILDAEFRDDPTPEGSTSRTTRTEEKLRLIPIAYSEDRPAPATGPNVEERTRAREELHRIDKILMNLPVGHPDTAEWIEQKLALAKTAFAREIAADTRSGLLDLRELVPQSLHAEPWVADVKAAAERTGLGTAWAPLLHVVADEAANGRRGVSDEDCIAEITRRHGEEKGTAICDAARAAARHLPSGLRAFLSAKNLLANPVLVEALGKQWLRAHPQDADQ